MSRSATGLPFDDFRALIAQMPGRDEAAVAAIRARDGELTKPAGSLGRMEDLVEWLGGWQGAAQPAVNRPLVAIFAGNHGVAAHGVSAFPSSVTQQMVENFAAGGAAINQICIANDLSLKVFDLALDIPTGDITFEAAMDEAGCAATMAFGMESIAGGADLLCVGAAGGGNLVVASAVAAKLYGDKAADWCDDARLIDTINLALETHVSAQDPLEILRQLGGRELAAMAGAIIAARFQLIPVLLDGFVACVAAAVLHKAEPSALDHCLAAHASGSAPHARLLQKLGKTPLLETGILLEDGTGAAFSLALLRGAVACHNEMATNMQLGTTLNT